MLWESNEIYLNLPEKNLSFLGSFVHQNLKRCGGFRVLTLPPNQASQFAINKSMPDIEFGEFWPNELDPFINADYSLTKGNEVNEWFEATSEIYLNSIISKLSSYHTRYYNSPEGIASQKWIGSEWEKLSKDRSDMSVTYFKHQKFEQPSLILTITGSDEVKKNKIIILGGHGDSINTDDPEKGLRSPGADDNAAGIAVISDIIKLIVEKNYRPKHTIEFIAYAAEEVGLQGSNELAELYHKNQKQVMGVMQFDGVNFTGKTFDLALIADGTNKDQTLFVAKLVDEYLKANWTWEKCGYACSDHYSWHVQGYRTSFPVEAISTEQNPFIHTSEDTFEKSSFNSKKANLFEKLGIAYLLELDK
jgi:leucyl aminopeptidase